MHTGRVREKKSIHQTGVKIHSGMWLLVALRGSQDWEATTRWWEQGQGGNGWHKENKNAKLKGRNYSKLLILLTNLWGLHWDYVSLALLTFTAHKSEIVLKCHLIKMSRTSWKTRLCNAKQMKPNIKIIIIIINGYRFGAAPHQSDQGPLGADLTGWQWQAH